MRYASGGLTSHTSYAASTVVDGVYRVAIIAWLGRADRPQLPICGASGVSDDALSLRVRLISSLRPSAQISRSTKRPSLETSCWPAPQSLPCGLWSRPPLLGRSSRLPQEPRCPEGNLRGVQAWLCASSSTDRSPPRTRGETNSMMPFDSDVKCRNVTKASEPDTHRRVGCRPRRQHKEQDHETGNSPTPEHDDNRGRRYSLRFYDGVIRRRHSVCRGRNMHHKPNLHLLHHH